MDYLSEPIDFFSTAEELGISPDEAFRISMLGIINQEIKLGTKHFDEQGNLLRTAASVLKCVDKGATIVLEVDESRKNLFFEILPEDG